MKITYKFCFIFVLVCNNLTYLFGQNYCNVGYDHTWIMGGIDLDTINDEFGGSEINFNTSPLSYKVHPKSVRMPFQNVSMSSRSGDLAFYSNGCTVFNASDIEMENGDSLNPGEIYTNHCPFYGYTGLQNMFALPDSYLDSIYYLFYIDLVFNRDPGAPFIVQPQHLYCTLINTKLNNALGKVIDKNKVILNDTSMMGDPMTAVKHANGIDWWIITPNRWTNSFNRILLDQDGAHFEGRQYVGPIPDPSREGGQGKFSPDGSHFAWYHPLGGLFLYDFDRESGLLSNFRHIEIPQVDFITGGCEFSPSGQFLYVNHDTSLFQLDLLAPDIQASLTHIADFDRFADPLATYFFFMERTPDKRIIMNVLNGSQWLHVIQEPDKRGLACRFEQHAIKLPTVNNFTLPHFPNYRLGALGEALCDSTIVATKYQPKEQIESYRIIPNPADDHFYLQPLFNSSWSYPEITLYDLFGHKILSTHDIGINTSLLSSGMYIVNISEGQKIMQQSKLIINRF